MVERRTGRFRRHHVALRQSVEPDPLVDALAAETRHPHDVRDRATSAVECPDLGELLVEGPGMSRLGRLLVVQLFPTQWSFLGASDGLMLAAHLLLQFLSQAVGQMETICHLPGPRRTPSGAFCVEAMPVTANDLDAGMAVLWKGQRSSGSSMTIWVRTIHGQKQPCTNSDADPF
jgi:hypothetical protein